MTTITRMRALIACLAALTLAINGSASPLPSVALAGAAPLIVTVNSTDWHDCDPNIPSQITLACAIDRADAAPADGVKTIKFAIPASDGGCAAGVCTISPHASLPAITTPNLTLDGYSQAGARPNTASLHSAPGDNAAITVQIDGTRAGPGAYAVQVQASNVTVDGLSITNFTQRYVPVTGGYIGGIAVTVSGTGVKGVRIVGNWLGVLPNNTAGRGNAYGIQVRTGATQTAIGSPAPRDRNLISGDSVAGIMLSNSTRNSIAGNFIGTDRTGARALPNAYGVVLTGEGTKDSTTQATTGDTIGGSASGSGNVIGGNTSFGIFAATDTGSSAAATRTARRRLHGTASAAPSPARPPRTAQQLASVGGPALSDGRNQNAVIQGNYVGTDLTGTKSLPNGTPGASPGMAAGIALWNAYTFTVGGTVPGAGNLISGNASDGVSVNGPVFDSRPAPENHLRNHVFQGNTVGVSAAGTALPNAGNGFTLANGSADEVIQNTIADNKRVGVQAGNSELDLTWVWISQNSMYGNGLSGIILGAPPAGAADVRTKNQVCLTEYNLDTNDEQIPCPVIKSATTDEIMGEGDGFSTLEFFLAASGSDDEGKTYLGSVWIPPRCSSETCTGASDWKISTNQLKVKPKPGQFITVTVTDRPTYGISPQNMDRRMGVTSQFSRAAPVGVPLKVTTTADNPAPCTAVAYSLRCAITQANADRAGDRIDFAIPSTDPNCAAATRCQVAIARQLPAITASSTMINGYSQGGHPNTNPSRAGDNAVVPVWLSSNVNPASSQGGAFSADLTLSAPWDVVEGLALTTRRGTVSGDGIDISGTQAQWDMVLGTFAGLRGDGVSTGMTNTGVSVMGGASHAFIGFLAPGDVNVMSGNRTYGLSLAGPDPSNPSTGPDLVMGNYIGTTPAANAALSNGVGGMYLYGTQRAGIGTYQEIQDVGNLISGNGGDGIDEIGGHENQISGNGIGVGATGSNGPVALSNALAGIWLYSGLENAFTTNDIDDNGADGVDITGETEFSFEHNTIENNGSHAGGGEGVYVTNAADTEGTAGVRRHAGPPRSAAVGGYNELDGDISQNQVTGNGGPGIMLGAPGYGSADRNIHVTMSQNSMANNKGLGIDLSDGPGDCRVGSGTGPNDYLQCPIIFNAFTTQVYGSACPGCTVEVFETDAYGEGQQYVGSATADPKDGSWELDLSGRPLPPGLEVTATATSTGISPETSEFSPFAIVQELT